MHITNRQGFTLLEILLSVALLAIISGIGIPVYQSWATSNDAHNAAAAIVLSMRQAQTFSQTGQLDDSWGVLVATGTVTIFKGESFATRDSDFDLLTPISNKITISGLSEIAFAPVTGFPLATGTLAVTLPPFDTYALTLTNTGIIQY